MSCVSPLNIVSIIIEETSNIVTLRLFFVVVVVALLFLFLLCLKPRVAVMKPCYGTKISSDVDWQTREAHHILPCEMRHDPLLAGSFMEVLSLL